MCFILNRQNIDGVCRVSAAIRARRGEDVVLHAAPMRTARHDTAEESDARARALSELVKVGGFAADDAASDFKSFHIPAGDNVPFYETIAQLAAVDPRLDILTLSYLRLASNLVGRELSIPTFPEGWIEAVRARLQPKQATVEYIAKLSVGEPSRAAEEILQLLDNAFEMAADDDELDRDYVQALTNAALDMDSDDVLFGVSPAQERALELLRALHAREPVKWRSALIDALARAWDVFGFAAEDDDAVTLLEELDVLLAQSTSLADKIRRLSYRRDAARQLFFSRKHTAALQALSQAGVLLGELLAERSSLNPTQRSELLNIEIDTLRLRGDISIRTRDLNAGIKSYQAALSKTLEFDAAGSSRETQRQLYSSHLKLVAPLIEVGEFERAGEHSLAAMRAAVEARVPIPTQISVMARPIINIGSGRMAAEFLELLVGVDAARAQAQFAAYYSRKPEAAVELFEALGQLLMVTYDQSASLDVELASRVRDFGMRVLQGFVLRSQPLGDKRTAELRSAVITFANALAPAGISVYDREQILELLARLRARRTTRRSLGTDDT
jgi:hypothetical protein